MKIRRIIFIFSFSFILFSTSKRGIFASDSIAGEKSIYIAYDITKPIRYAFNQNFKQQEISFALYTGKEYNFSGDIGFGNVFFNKDNYDIEAHIKTNDEKEDLKELTEKALKIFKEVDNK